MALPSGVRFNNPLNVRPDGRSKWQGVIAVEHTGAGDFLHFDGPAKGWRCAAGNVIAHYDRWGHDTIATLIGGSGSYGQPDYRPGWAPPQDRNDTAAYIARVTGATGFAANAVLDFHRYAHLKPVLLAMAAVEQGGDPYRWWNDQQIDWGLAQYGVLRPPRPLGTMAPAAGAAAATAAATGSAIAPTYPPPLPGLPAAPPGSIPAPIDPGVVIERGQTFLQQYGYLFKWGGVALLALIAAGLAWHWWLQRQKNRPARATS